jgi:hypothetical protein
MLASVLFKDESPTECLEYWDFVFDPESHFISQLTPGCRYSLSQLDAAEI